MMDPPTILQNSDSVQDPPMDIKMECDDVTEEDDYFSAVTTETTDDTTDTDVKNEVNLPIKMAPPEESMTLEDFVNQETVRQKNPIIANQLEGPILNQQLENSSKPDEPEIGMPPVDRSAPLSMSLPIALPPGQHPLLTDHALSDTGMMSDTSVLTKVDAPQTKNTLLKQIIDKACLKLAREGEESLFLSVNIEKKLCSFVGTETGRHFLTKRPDIMEHFFQFCQAVYKARGDLVTTEGTSSTGDDSDVPTSPKKPKPQSPSLATPQNKMEVSKGTNPGHPMTRSQSKGGKSHTAQNVQENKKTQGRVQSSRPSRKKRGQNYAGKEKAVKVEPSIEIVSDAQSDLEMECEGQVEEGQKSDPLNDPDIIKLSKDLENTDASWDTNLQNEGSGKLVVFNVTSKPSDSSTKEAKKDVKLNGSDRNNLKSPKPEIDIKAEPVAATPCSMPCFPMFEKCSSSLANCKGLNVGGNKDSVSSDPSSPNKAKNYEILTDLLDNQNPNIASPYILSVPTLQNANAPIVKQESSISPYKSPSRRRNKDGKKPKMCHRYSREERDEIAEYAIKHGLTKSADHFNKLWNMKLTPSTIFYFRKTYLRDKKNEESSKEEIVDTKGGNYLSSNGALQNIYSYEKKNARKSINSPNRRKPKTKLDEAEKVLQEMELKQKILKICSMEKKNADGDSIGNSSALKENSDTGQHLLNNVDVNQGGNFLVYNVESMESVWSGEDAARQNFALEMGFPNNHILQPKYCLLPTQKDMDSLVLQKPINNTNQLEVNNSDFTTRRDQEIIIEGLKDPNLTQSLPNIKHQNGTADTSPKSDGKSPRVSRRKNTPRKALATSFPIEIKEFTKEEEIEIAKYAMDHSLQDTATFFQILWNVHLDTDTVKVFKDNYLQGSQEERGINDDDPDSCFTYVL